MLRVARKDTARAWATTALRLVMGIGFFVHGWAKLTRGPDKLASLLHQVGVPFPELSAWAETLLELFGGLALIIGVFVALVSIPLIVSQLVAMFTVQVHYGFSSVNTIGLTLDGPVFGPPGYEINLLYIAGLLAVMLAEPDALSLDHWLAGERRASM